MKGIRDHNGTFEEWQDLKITSLSWAKDIESELSKESANIPMQKIVLQDEIPEIYPHLYSETSWKWAVKNRATNGLAPAFNKIGRKIFVNLDVLAQCLTSDEAG